jgi:hypothetical protein
MTGLIPTSVYRTGAKHNAIQATQDGSATNGASTATWPSCAGRFVQDVSPKPHLQKHIQKHCPGELFEALGRICGGAPFVAIPQAPPKTGGRSFGSFLRGACRTRRQLFSHPFVGALIKKGIRLWVINHNSRFVMHRLIPNSLYQSGAKYTMQDGTTATWQSCAGGCVRGGVPKAHLQKHIKKTSKSGGAFRGLGARLAQKKHPERPQNWDCLRCLQDGPANERCIQGDVAELHRMVCPPRFAQAEPQKHTKNITKNSP